MAKQSSQVTALERLRGRTWVEKCMEVAGCNQAGLAKEVSAVPDKDLWSKYKNGHAKPRDPTVDVVGQILKGTAEVWFLGPMGLPLWTVLEQDAKACRQIVSETVGRHVGAKPWMVASHVPVADMDNLELVQALLEQVIPNAWARPQPEPDVSDLLGSEDLAAAFEEAERRAEALKEPRRDFVRSDNFYSLAELAGLEPNALAQQYAFFKNFVKGAKGVKDVEPGELRDWNLLGERRKYPVLLAESSVALLAAAVVCNGSSELLLKDVAYFITTGLKEPLTDHFGPAVAQYVEENL